MSDLIRREDAIEAVRLATVETRSIGRGDILYILYSIPSAEQVTGKLKNPCDSLLKTDSEACKEQKSKLDLISRQDAIDAVTGAIWHYHNECYKNLNVYEVAEALVSDAIKLLPSRITEYKTFCGVPIEEAARIVQEHNAEPKTGECSGCKFIGSYDLDFPCVNCVRKTKDYYCGARMRGEEE